MSWSEGPKIAPVVTIKPWSIVMMNELRIFSTLAAALVSVLITAGMGLVFEYGHLV